MASLIAGLVGRAFGPCIAVVIAKNIVSAHLSWRRRHLNDAKTDLHALNSHALLLVPFPTRFSPTSIPARGILGSRKTAKQECLIKNHKTFCAQWARAAKARFNFARQCERSAINVAALHRWFTAEFKKLGMTLLQISYVIDDVVDIALEPTYERMVSESKKQFRHRARMEFYNERKSIEKIR